MLRRPRHGDSKRSQVPPTPSLTRVSLTKVAGGSENYASMLVIIRESFTKETETCISLYSSRFMGMNQVGAAVTQFHQRITV